MRGVIFGLCALSICPSQLIPIYMYTPCGEARSESKVSCHNKKHSTSTSPSHGLNLRSWLCDQTHTARGTSELPNRTPKRGSKVLTVEWVIKQLFCSYFSCRITTITARNSLAKSWTSWKNYSKVFSQRYVGHFPYLPFILSVFVNVLSWPLIFNSGKWKLQCRPRPCAVLSSKSPNFTNLCHLCYRKLKLR